MRNSSASPRRPASGLRGKRGSADSQPESPQGPTSTVVDQGKKDILNLSRVDKCLINMEELEMEVKMILQNSKDEEDDSENEKGKQFRNPFKQ